MSRTATITVRFRLDRENECKAYGLLQNRGKEDFGSLSQAAITAINEFYDRKDKLADDPYLETREKEDAFLTRVLETVAAGIQANSVGSLAAVLQNMTANQAVASNTSATAISADEAADLDVALKFIDDL